MPDALPTRLTAPDPPPFALLHRGNRAVEVLIGSVVTVDAVADIPVGPSGSVALLPFRQLAERGLPCHDDGTPLRVLVADERHTVDLESLPHPTSAPVRDAGFTTTDAAYADLARRVRDEDLGVDVTHCLLRRDFSARLEPGAAVGLFAALLRAETGAYWTFAVHDGTRALVGATPQGQVRLRDGEVVLRPTCGTYRYPPSGPEEAGLLAFLADRKESDELTATVDAELALLCALEPDAITVDGPLLVPMGTLAHTACVLRGRGGVDAHRALAGTMFASTAIGAPLAGALRVIEAREPTGRGYYGGAVALFEPNGDLDAATLIRTADLDPSGRLTLSVGATIGADSDPDAEAHETHHKVAGLVRALQGPSHARPAGGGSSAATRDATEPDHTGTPPPAVPHSRTGTPAAPRGDVGAPGTTPHPRQVSGGAPVPPSTLRVAEALARRREEFGAQWTTPAGPVPDLGPLLVVDLGHPAAWTLAHLARRLGWRATVVRVADVDPARLPTTVLCGPTTDPRSRVARDRLRAVAERRGCRVHQVDAGFRPDAVRADPDALAELLGAR
ncbi:chorismate-binding protein [Actinosynnema sp. NPDC020468]|uniref:chorismate-binding protein n=1 Tax=Actinosynnema sp. NPDC020468 TaxID=3154488 RepID=UPI003406D072